MRLMLSATHETLLQGLRDVHAAQLETRSLRILQLQEKLEAAQILNRGLESRLETLIELVASQQETIKTAMSDLVILKGAGRIRNEQEKQPPPVELRPDIEITDAPTDTAARRQLLKEAQEEYDHALEKLSQEIDTSNVSPEAVKAAIPESPEAWRREHAQEPAPSLADLIPGG